ncbi:11235_t:CDS:1 [Paraglomus occultum]|uniref:11235_t:CDS:1 n=1 Tax=Paraglomus occultum TaxID=144539 RepID=A0A9N9AD88_9GLOM|nr:11235_t:CDS:1 [Paraglomus occultum]
MPAIPQHVNQLMRIDKLSKEWARTHAQSCAVFSLLVNIETQREATLSFTSNPPSYLDSKTINLLIYKQTGEIADNVLRIHRSLDEFAKIVKSMRMALHEISKLVLASSAKTNIDDALVVSDLSVDSAHLYATRIIDMYEKELAYKRGLVFGGLTLDNVEIVTKVWESWAGQSRINFEVEEDVMDKIKVWQRCGEYANIQRKTVKKRK